MRRLLRVGLLIVVGVLAWHSWGACVSGDCRNGTGTYVWDNGDRYEGEWRNGQTHGRGNITWASGNRYEGEWRDGERSGQGTYTYEDGGRYVGGWRDGKRHGRGTLTFSDGPVPVGRDSDKMYEDCKYLGTVAEVEERVRQEQEKKEEQERIYNACILEKSKEYDMNASSVAGAVRATCRDISENPSWLDKLRYR